MDNELTAEAVVPAQNRAELPPGFYETIDVLKSIVRGAHLRAQLEVNTDILLMYWEIGRTILERQGAERSGTKVVERIATGLRTEFPDQRGFSRSNLCYMQQTARTWPRPDCPTGCWPIALGPHHHHRRPLPHRMRPCTAEPVRNDSSG
ncbi:DUF1016 N-terminal domain-containing protein [Streptomyces sp. NPDC057287]|uniref:DUF1016 N-terminal domain-containing protein n=1 Tax=Streptomyces sp. NPDC057287 TaxID=3346086 RepID=UPI003644E97C